MELEIKRLGGDSDTTIGAWYVGEGMAKYLFCFSIEDERRINKIAGKTRIPAGRYEIILNKTGGMNQKYAKYPWHKGMLELDEVEGFDFIYIHPGNTDDDTEGCLLPNYKADANSMRGENSFECYKDLYLEVISAIQDEEQVFITIKDEEF
tara:strand:- start:16810 stop:17262 length:453 start_codon:yes stop_codon:yes gene_type:complete